MAVIKCKMCGGDLDISEGLSVCECEYCGTKQTVPKVDDEKKLTLFARANRLRAANEFDKAAGVYESIVADFPEESEAYWGLVLCRYGIEYVDDPATGKKVPTCHRSSFDSVLEDTDFEQACENADGIARRQYREEAKQLEDIRRGIIEVSGKEAPYDIFICYKETDEDGQRTVDSVIAQDVYDALTEKGYRVFFSRISLEDKLGTEYEPYIFAALNSAKVMLAFGTDYEHYNAVWVKNEWSRFLKLMEKDKGKYLIPCYKDLDAYDMPKEFQRLQAQDMGKVGAVQDLLRGIGKILPRDGEKAAPETPVVVQSGGPNVTALLDRGEMALEDGAWDKAKDYYDQVLNMDAKNAGAWLGLMLAGQRLHTLDEIGGIDDLKKLDAVKADRNYSKFLRFASEEQKQSIEALLSKAKPIVEAQAERERKAAVERTARKFKEKAERAEQRKTALKLLQGSISTGGALGRGCTVGVKADGTVVAKGYSKHGQCDVTNWTDIVSVSVGEWHTVGLRSDGAVVAVGGNKQGQCNVSGWRNIVAVATGLYHTIGLKSDGTVVAVGYNKQDQCKVNDWTDIVAIATGPSSHTVGLRSDGTVVAVGDNKQGQCDVKGWTDIVAVSAGGRHTVGLRSDGTVVAVGDNKQGQCDVKSWTDIVAVSAGLYCTVGMKADGTAVATKYIGDRKYYHGEGEVTGWRNIIAISTGGGHTVGVREDGTVVAAGRNDDGQCGVDNWRLFSSLGAIEQERSTRKARAEQTATEAHSCRPEELNAEKAALTSELSNLKGLFPGKRKSEIEARLAAIEAELTKLN